MVKPLNKGQIVPPVETTTIGPVQIFATGVHKEGDREYTEADLSDMVTNHVINLGMLKPPGVLGHSAPDSAPATGRLVRTVRDGGRLFGWFSDVPVGFAKLWNAGLYSGVSIEVYDDPPPPFQGQGCMIRRVAWLGAELPAVKGMADPPPARFAFCERLEFRSVTRLLPAGYRRVYQEKSQMDRKALEDQLASIGFTAQQIEALKGLDDESFAAFVNTTLAAKAGAGDGGGDPATSNNADRAGMEAELIAAGIATAEELAVMDDDQVLQMYQQFKAGSFSDDKVKPPVKPGNNGGGDTVTVTKAEYAEMQKGVRAVKVTYAKIDADLKRRAYAERHRTVKTLCATWLEQKKILPADAAENSKTPNLFNRLMNADGDKVRKYGEKNLTEFDSLVEEVSGRGRDYVRIFSEKIKTGAADEDASDEALARKAAVDSAKAYAKKQNERNARARAKV